MARCNGCRCTDERACRGGCSWVYQSPAFNICSRCAGGEKDMRATLERIETLTASHPFGGRNVIGDIAALVRHGIRRHEDLVEADEKELRAEQRQAALKQIATRRVRKLPKRKR